MPRDRDERRLGGEAWREMAPTLAVGNVGPAAARAWPEADGGMSIRSSSGHPDAPSWTRPRARSYTRRRVHPRPRRGAGNTPESSGITVGDLHINLIARTVTRAGRPITLQPREHALLEYLARNAGRIVSKTMIIEHVWDYNFDPQTNIVESRICRLREKVDAGFDAPLIHAVRGMGYVLRVGE